MESAPLVEEGELYRADELATFVIENMGTPLPRVELLRNYVPMDLTKKEIIIERIKALNKEHRSQLSLLYVEQARELRDMDESYYRIQDDRDFPPTEEDLILSLEKRLETDRRLLIQGFDYVAIRFRIAHIKIMLPLYRKLKQVKEEEIAGRRLRESRFPTTIPEFEALGAEFPHSQVTVARFLTFSTEMRIALAARMKWEPQDCRPLILVHQTNPDFAAAVQKLAASSATTDPRRKPTL